MQRFKNMLLIYPEFPSNTYWSFKYALKFISRKSAIPPLGLITVAALFPKSYNLKVIDMNVEPLDENDIKNADAVFISAMLVQKNHSMKSSLSATNITSLSLQAAPTPRPAIKTLRALTISF